MATALVSLGSNLGDRRLTLDAAVTSLRELPGINDLSVSSYYATKSIGGPLGQEAFLNAAARMETELPPQTLLAEMQQIEQKFGRLRDEHWAARTLDLDLLLYDHWIISEPDLTVPHRFLPFRRFVLEPAKEVAGDLVHPVLGWSVEKMLTHLETAKDVFEVAGVSEVIRAEFAARVAQRCSLSLASRVTHLDGGRDKPVVELSFTKPSSAATEEGYIVDSCGAQWISEAYPGRLVEWSDSQLADLREHAEEVFTTPKAIFLLDAPSAWYIGADRMLALRGASALPYCDGVQQLLLGLVRERAYTPTLLLPADDLERAESEAVAAIEAMR